MRFQLFILRREKKIIRRETCFGLCFERPNAFMCVTVFVYMFSAYILYADCCTMGMKRPVANMNETKRNRRSEWYACLRIHMLELCVVFVCVCVRAVEVSLLCTFTSSGSVCERPILFGSFAHDCACMPANEVLNSGRGLSLKRNEFMCRHTGLWMEIVDMRL